MFEKASRLKLRFETPMGLISTEDLWNLPLTSVNKVNLYDIARDLHKKVKADEDLPFLSSDKVEDSEMTLRFEIVKHIIEVRKIEQSNALKAKENAELKKRILQIVAEQDEQNLRSKSKEELMEILKTL